VKAENVIEMIRRFVAGKRGDAIALVRAIAADEATAGRHRVSRSIERILASVPRQLTTLHGAPQTLGTVPANRPLASIVLGDTPRQAVAELIREWQYREQLAAEGLPVRRVVLLHGPSGNGKTTLANAIATELAMPLVVARYEHLVDSHLGATGANVAKVFEYAGENPCVLLIDEADAVVSCRINGASEGHREGNRIVTSVILGLDSLSDSLVVLATNAAEQIDPAIMRRCALALHLPSPSAADRERLCCILQSRWPVLSKCGDWPRGVEACKSLAAVEEHALAAARRWVIAHSEAQ
jgi:broad-specificity NMP kinase